MMEDPDRSPYDVLLARYLHTVLHARLYVGDDLRTANLRGFEAAFGALLRRVPEETLLAAYDDSAFGRGRKGFVVTDRHLHIVQPDVQGSLPLEHVASARYTFPVIAVGHTYPGLPPFVKLRVDEPDAASQVQSWLFAVAAFNRTERGDAGFVITARQALGRLERLVESKRLRTDDALRLVALAKKAEELKDARRKRKRS